MQGTRVRLALGPLQWHWGMTSVMLWQNQVMQFPLCPTLPWYRRTLPLPTLSLLARWLSLRRPMTVLLDFPLHLPLVSVHSPCPPLWDPPFPPLPYPLLVLLPTKLLQTGSSGSPIVTLSCTRQMPVS